MFFKILSGLFQFAVTASLIYWVRMLCGPSLIYILPLLGLGLLNYMFGAVKTAITPMWVITLLLSNLILLYIMSTFAIERNFIIFIPLVLLGIWTFVRGILDRN